MAKKLTSAIVKEYAIKAGASVVGITVPMDFGLAPNGFKPADVLPGCLSVIVLDAALSPDEKLRIKCFLCRTICPHAFKMQDKTPQQQSCGIYIM